MSSDTLKHTFTLTVDVPLTWIKYLTYDATIFQRNYAGYWLCGVAYEENLGWLVYEEADDKAVGEARCEIVKKLWLAGEPLPERWFRLDRAAALRAWEEGVKRWGIDWYEETDAQREDVVVQLALLGEVRYG